MNAARSAKVPSRDSGSPDLANLSTGCEYCLSVLMADRDGKNV